MMPLDTERFDKDIDRTPSLIINGQVIRADMQTKHPDPRQAWIDLWQSIGATSGELPSIQSFQYPTAHTMTHLFPGSIIGNNLYIDNTLALKAESDKVLALNSVTAYARLIIGDGSQTLEYEIILNGKLERWESGKFQHYIQQYQNNPFTPFGELEPLFDLTTETQIKKDDLDPRSPKNFVRSTITNLHPALEQAINQNPNPNLNPYYRTPTHIKTQAVAEACEKNSKTVTYAMNPDTYVTISNTGKKFRSPRKIFLETCSEKTVEALKRHGLIQGSTPTAIAIAKLGEYRRQLIAETNYGVISASHQQKLKICDDAYKALVALEQDELNVNFTHDKDRHAFIQRVKDELHKAINQNKIDCASLFHREGRMESLLVSAMVELDDKFERAYTKRAPEAGDQSLTAPAYFSRADQCYFEFGKPAQVRPVELTEHLSDYQALDFLSVMERGNLDNPAQGMEITNNPLKRAGLIGSSKKRAIKASDSVYLSERRSFLQRLAHGVTAVPGVITHFIKRPLYDLREYLRKQVEEMAEIASAPFKIDQVKYARRLLVSEKEMSESDIAPLLDNSEDDFRIGPSSAIESNPDASQATLLQSDWLKPIHHISSTAQYDNLIAKLLYITQENLKKFDTLSKSHEVIALAVTVGGIASLLVLFKAGVIHGALKSFIQNLFQIDGAATPETVLRTLGMMDYAAESAQLLSNNSMESMDKLEKSLTDPLKLLELLATHAAMATQLTTSFDPKLNPNSINVAHAVFANLKERLINFRKTNPEDEPDEILDHETLLKFKILTENALKKQQHYLNRKKKPLSFFGSVLVFPLKPVFAILKPMINLSAATIASIRFGNISPLRIAVKEIKEKFIAGSKNMGLMAIDFTDKMLERITDLAEFVVRVPTRSIFTILRKTIGTIDSAIHLFTGKSPLNAVVKGLVKAENFIVDKGIVGLGDAIRHGITRLFQPLRNRIHPNGPIERLKALAKTMETCNQYFKHERHFLEKRYPVFAKSLEEKIEAIQNFTQRIKTLCEDAKKDYKENKDPLAKKAAMNALKMRITDETDAFREKLSRIDAVIDSERVASHQEIKQSVKFENQLQKFEKLVDDLPIELTRFPPTTFELDDEAHLKAQSVEQTEEEKLQGSRKPRPKLGSSE